jgi:hypothetical protein
MSRKGKLVTPRQYSEIHRVAYTTVMYWLNTDRIDGAVKHITPTGHYWELPYDAPRPKKLSGRPKKDGAAKKARKSSKKGAAK